MIVSIKQTSFDIGSWTFDILIWTFEVGSRIRVLNPDKCLSCMRADVQRPILQS